MNDITRVCAKCGESKPLWCYPKQPKMHDGIDIRCTDCVRAHRAQFEGKCIVKEKRRYARCR